MFNLVNLYNLVQIFYYSCQQSIYMFVSFQSSYFGLLKIIYIAILGIFTSLTPCFFSLLPIITSYITMGYINKTKIKREIFLFGLISSFIIVILTFYIFNYQSYKLLMNIPLISFGFWILISLNLLQILDISYFFSFIKINTNIYMPNIFIENYITGLAFGLSSISCSASIILTTIFWLSSSENIIQSCIYLCIYLVGCIVPFGFIFYFPLYIKRFNILVKFWNQFIPLSGALILTFSIFSLLDRTFS